MEFRIFQKCDLFLIPFRLYVVRRMVGGTIDFNGQQGGLIHSAKQEKVHMGQRISSIGRLIVFQQYVILQNIEQRHMNCVVYTGEIPVSVKSTR